jgi:stringent starvation protein B
MVFGSEPGSPDPDGTDDHGTPPQQEERPNGKPTLKVVK